MKKRNFIVSFILSICPGVGQIYNGQVKKGFIFFFTPITLLVILTSLKLNQTIEGLGTMIIILWFFYLYVLIDAVVMAIRKKQIHLKRLNKWYVYVLLISIYTMAIIPINRYVIGIRPYIIDGPSMMPTFNTNDRVFVLTKKNPLRRGEIITYVSPEDRIYIKRIIGLGGETIEIKDNQVYINDKTLLESYLKKDVMNINFSKMKIPANTVFVMGDNRPNSKDSRIMGPVSENTILGKIILKSSADQMYNFKKVVVPAE